MRRIVADPSSLLVDLLVAVLAGRHGGERQIQPHAHAAAPQPAAGALAGEQEQPVVRQQGERDEHWDGQENVQGLSRRRMDRWELVGDGRCCGKRSCGNRLHYSIGQSHVMERGAVRLRMGWDGRSVSLALADGSDCVRPNKLAEPPSEPGLAARASSDFRLVASFLPSFPSVGASCILWSFAGASPAVRLLHRLRRCRGR